MALVEFGATGFHETSMQAIAVRAGITKPVVYQHFPSKHDLYLEVLATVGKRLRDAIEAATATARTPHQIVEEGFRSYFSFFDSYPAAFRVLFGEASRSDLRFAQEVAAVESAVAEWVSAILTIDYLDPASRLLFGHAVVGLAEGTVRHWFATGREMDIETLTERTAELAWLGLRGRPS